MRNLQKYNAVVGSRNITLIDAPTDMTVENIRLIVNETQKVVICSSMQKDNIVSVSGSVITYADTLPVIADGDKFTIECDFGTSEEYQSLEQEVFAGKMSIANAIKLKGGSASNQHSLEVLAQDIATIPDPSGSAENPVVVQLADGGSAVAAIAKHYSAETPCAIAYVWLSADTETYTVSLPSCDKLALSDGTLQDTFAGGEVSIAPVSKQLWKYAVCMFATEHAAQNVAATYASGQAASLYELCVLNINIQAINGFSSTNARLILSDGNVNDVGNNAFQGYYFKTLPFDIKQISGTASFASCTSLQSVNLPSLTQISGRYAFQSCTSLQSVNLPSLTTISGSDAFQSCTSLQYLDLPSLTTILSDSIFRYCSSLQSVNLPSLTTIRAYAFQGCTSLQSLELPSLTTIADGLAFSNCTSLKHLDLSSIKTIHYQQTFINCQKLIRITIKQGTDFSLDFSTWNPTEALLTTSTSLVEEGEEFASNREKLLYNIRTYIAARLKDMTGLTAPTFTFGANLKTAITEDAETLAAFTSKNFNIA